MHLQVKFFVHNGLKNAVYEELLHLKKSQEKNKGSLLSIDPKIIQYITRTEKGFYTFNFANNDCIDIIFSGRRSSLLKGTDIGFNLRLPRYTAIKHLTGANAQFIIETVDRHTITLDGEITFIESTAMNKPLMSVTTTEEKI